MTDLNKQIAAVNQAIYQQIKKASYRVVVSVALLILNKSIPKAPVDTAVALSPLPRPEPHPSGS